MNYFSHDTPRISHWRWLVSMALGLIVLHSAPSLAQQTYEQQPARGWLNNIYIFTDAADSMAHSCSSVEGWLPGRIEYANESPPGEFKYWCLLPSASYPGQYYEYSHSTWTTSWSEQCQEGYSAANIDTSGTRLEIDVCQTTQIASGQPEVCRETACDSILLSSRRKIQTEIDYQGVGTFPLEFSRTYSSGRPGSVGTPSSLPSIQYWRHNYDRRLTGNLTSGAPTLPARYTIIGNTLFPEPPVSGGTSGGDINAMRPDGSTIFFPDLIADSNQRVSLAPTTLSSGAPGFVLTTADNHQELYDDTGRLVALRSRAGETHSLAYNASGQLLSVTDDYGKSLSFSYSGTDLTTVTDPSGNTISYTYNNLGDVLSVTYPDTGSGPKTRQYLYDASPRQLTGIIDENGQQYVSWSYDTDSQDEGLATESSGPNGIGLVQIDRHLSSSYITKTTNSLGLEVIYQFSTIGGAKLIASKERVATANTAAATETRSYNADGFLTTITDWNGNTTNFVRNSRGLPVVQTLAAGTAQERVISRQWHTGYRLPLSETFPDYQVDYGYDANGNVLTRTVTDSVTSNSRQWGFTYDALGNVLTVDGPRTDVNDITTYTYYSCSTGAECGQLATVVNALGQTTTYDTYNAHGQPTQITDPNGQQITLTYNSRLWMTSMTVAGATTTVAYDSKGNIEQITQPDGTYIAYERDAADRLVAVADAQNNRIEWTLDAAGNRIDEQIKDPSGQIRKSLQAAFDALSRVRVMTPAHGGTTTYTYDNNSNLITSTDASNRVTTSSVDALDRLIKTIDPLLGDTDYVYDDRDNLISVTDPEGLTTSYTYNGFDERITEQSPDTGTTTMTYDSAGNVATRTDARAIQASYTYDALNRITQMAYPDANENVSYTYDQGMNGIGRLTQISDASGSTSFGYDSRGNTTSVAYTIGAQSYTQTYTYNSANRLTDMMYPSGRSISYGYDTSGRINQVSSVGAEGSETLASSITRLPFGPTSAVTLGNGINQSRTYDQDYRVLTMADGSVFEKGYAYNTVNNITAITDVLNTANSQLFTYDALDRLEFAAGGYGDDDYTYDAVGNRLSMERDSQSESYQYGSTSHRLQSRGSVSYTYDAVGNTLAGNGTSFAYNDRNRMESVTIGGQTTTYSHNAMGQRVLKSSGGTQTHYVYDLAGRLIMEASGAGAVQVEYSYLDGVPLAMWRDNTAPPAPSILQNGGFESGLSNWFSCSNSGSTQVVSDPTEGTQALQITGGDCLYQEFPVTPDTAYVLQCQAKGDLTQYTSLTLTIMDQTYTNLIDQEVEVTSASYGTFTANVTAPASGTIGAVTFYSDDTGVFDACTVVPQGSTPPPPPPPPASSLLSNGGFESGLTDWFSCSSSGTTQTVSDSTEGTNALQITGSDCLYQEFPVTPNKSYTLQCDAKGAQTQYTSVQLTIMDAGYSNVASNEVEVTSTGYQAYSSTLAAPGAGAIGAVTFYSEDTGVFDACTVVEN